MPAGISTVSSILVLLLIVGVAIGLLALRHRLALRIGVRNVLRARRRTALLLAGLLVATTIISGSLVVGDTIDNLAVHYTILAIGSNDEVVGNQSPSGAYGYFPYSVYASVASATTGDSQIAGMAPEIVTRVSVLDHSSATPQPNLYLIGVNADQSTQLGSFVSRAGAPVVGPAPGGVLLDQLAASELNATAGDSVSLYGAGARELPMQVQAVVQDNLRGAFPTGGLGNYGSVFVNLSNAQTLQGVPGMINFLSVTNTGDLAERLAHASSVNATLNATLATIPAASGLSIQELLQKSLTQEETAASAVTTLFLVLGLFSILAGALLIVGVFLLLAEERKGEMGLLRAVGLRRRELVYSYLFEGTIYSAGSALAGTAVGVGVGYGLTYAFGILLGSQGLTPTALLDSFTVLPSTLVIAYAAGFLLTLVTVIVASYRASRLNIVRSLRELPEPDPPVRTYTYAAVLGALAMGIGGLLYARTAPGSADLSYPIVGGAVVIAGAGLLAARFWKNRPVFSAVGLALLFWGGYEPLRTVLLGPLHGGGVYGAFTEGIVMVSGAILLYAFNSSALANALTKLAGGRSRRAPVARIGLSHPGRRPGRTTISLSIFALVAFALVVIAGVGSSLNASLGTLERDESGGYALVAYSATSAPALPALVAGNSTLAGYFRAVVPLAFGGVRVAVDGSSTSAFDDDLYSGPAGEPAASDFYTTNQYTYLATLDGRSAAQVSAELASVPGVAVVDRSYSTAPNNLQSSPPPGHPKVDPGAVLTLTNPVNGNVSRVTVIGVMTQTVLSGVIVGPATAAALGISAQRVFLLALSPGVAATQAVRATQSAFFPYGLVVVDIQGAVASSIATTEGEIGLLQIFVALGLIVGIAGMGILALRAVVERRREIGMLRANGFTEGMLVRSFLLEYSFVALLGLGIGTSLGLLLVWNLTHGPAGVASSITTFAMPWSNLAVIVAAAYGLSMLAVAGPTRLAARLPPAQAVRPTE